MAEACDALDPCCAPVEDLCFKCPAGEKPCCGCADIRSVLLVLGVVLAVLAFLDLIDLSYGSGFFQFLNGCTLAFFVAATYSVHAEEKGLAKPALVCPRQLLRTTIARARH